MSDVIIVSRRKTSFLEVNLKVVLEKQNSSRKKYIS